ncbi:hypothetical protein NOR_05126 [Metarhizium rileyi]|uniref:Uncharacterized protein n=1 Tax=Metarhizium rileyi (strain RCEF 4871) TaxID=1649241 RepID=A0A167DEB0_METRR|nr:hypothetical protein NOR_05126 [Metarhizium rileyi RCEF 4871]TWU72441.1 hypothetical protein ED733_003495 [Metarhizium rileyi]
MSRVTAPMSKISRALSASSSAVAARTASPLLDSSAHSAGAALMPKYAELLRNRNVEHSDSSRGITTTHRPTPQPSIVNRSKPLMQTFHSSASEEPLMRTSTTHIDSAILPSMSSLVSPSAAGQGPRVPLLPDNYGAAHTPVAFDANARPEVTIVAANPDNVVPGAPLSEVEGIGLDGIELKFMYDESGPPRSEGSGGMIRDIWKGMVEDVFGGDPKKAA